MPTKKFRPTSPARRFMTVSTFEDITKTTPEKGLTSKKSKHSGRNSYGRITVRHRGGGAVKKYRIIDCVDEIKESVENKKFDDYTSMKYSNYKFLKELNTFG